MTKSKEWVKGYLTALHDFAWWKDGTMLVGSGIYTYTQIADKILKENNMTREDLK